MCCRAGAEEKHRQRLKDAGAGALQRVAGGCWCAAEASDTPRKDSRRYGGLGRGVRPAEPASTVPSSRAE